MLLGRANDAKLVQPEKALSPIVFTEFGTKIDVKEVHLENE